jgi:glycosyltransferase involved in cell wall biosynthesis
VTEATTLPDAGPGSPAPTLLLFTLTRLEDMRAKGNIEYVRHYERYFGTVYVAYLVGGRAATEVRGATSLVSLGSGHLLLDLLLAPWRLLRLAQRIGPDAYLTADQVFGWWTSLLLRLRLRARVRLLPVCQPEVIYASTGRALSPRLPIRLERLFVRWTFASVHRVVTARAFGSFVDWLSRDPAAAGKLVVVDSTVEALPSPGFLAAVARAGGAERPQTAAADEVVYVGRLNAEKLVDDLVRMMAHLVATGTAGAIRLRLIGDGSQRGRLETLARELAVSDRIEFAGMIANEELPGHLFRARAFVSTLTGTSLREAALCGVPVVAYDVDWLSGLLVHEEHALLVPHRDHRALGAALVRLLNDDGLQRRLSANVRALAQRLWSPQSVALSLEVSFADEDAPSATTAVNTR